jgi:ribosomal protein S12 methylthiotransferase
MGDILKEAEILAEKGAKEIIITAQETSAYGRDLREKTGLSTLMKKMAAIEGIKWIRLLYTYPATLTDEIFRTISEEEKICKYIDIPVQHIDDDILCTMNRKGNGDFIRSILTSARKIIPGVALRTSLIVGFPGETPAKFKRLLDFVKETAFDHLGVFEYSREEGTAAAELPRHVSEKTKEARKKIIMEEQAAISFRINQSLIGSVEEMLIEGKSEIPGYSYTGRLQRQAPDIDGVTHIKTKNKKPGDIVKCRIDSADEYDLYGEESAEHEK